MATNYKGRALAGDTPNTVTTTNPTVNDDSTRGYVLGSTWINTATNAAFVCVNRTPGAAVWNAASIVLPGTATTSLTNNSGGVVSNTIAVVTAPPALTDSTGGTAATTIAAITAGSSYAQADMVSVKNGLAQLVLNETANGAAIVSLTNAVASLTSKVDAIITALKASGILS